MPLAQFAYDRAGNLEERTVPGFAGEFEVDHTPTTEESSVYVLGDGEPWRA